MKTCGVYAIKHVASGRHYVGSSIDVPTRWRAHRRELDRGTHHAPILQSYWSAHGEEAFEFILLAACSPEDRLTIEQDRIDALAAYGWRTGFNASPTAGTPKGVERRPETREKLRVANLGKKASPETRAKMRAAHRGRTPNLGKRASAETRQRMSRAGLGRDMSAISLASPVNKPGYVKSIEHRANIAQARTGTATSPEVRAKIAEGVRRVRAERFWSTRKT